VARLSALRWPLASVSSHSRRCPVGTQFTDHPLPFPVAGCAGANAPDIQLGASTRIENTTIAWVAVNRPVTQTREMRVPAPLRCRRAARPSQEATRRRANSIPYAQPNPRLLLVAAPGDAPARPLCATVWTTPTNGSTGASDIRIGRASLTCWKPCPEPIRAAAQLRSTERRRNADATYTRYELVNS
jgi:hypothetical protein